MKQIIANYICRKVFDDFKSQRPIDDTLAESLNQYPLIDSLRDVIELSDFVLLKDIVANSSIPLGNLAISLMRNIDRDDNVKDYLLFSFRQATLYKRKIELLWRLLDGDQLPVSVHKEGYLFVSNNLSIFIDDIREGCGGIDNVMNACKSRLADDSFPHSKDWLYLCTAMGSPDKTAVANLLEEYQSSKNTFTSLVVKEMQKVLPSI